MKFQKLGIIRREEGTPLKRKRNELAKLCTRSNISVGRGIVSGRTEELAVQQ